MRMLFNYKKGKIYIGLFITLILIFLIIKVVDFKVVLKILANFDFHFFFLLILFYLFGMTIRTIRWRCLIKQKKKIAFSSVLFALAIGFMVNNLLPLKIGEVVRAENITRESSISRSFLLGTVFAERMLDSLLLLVLLSLSVLFSKTLIKVIQTNIWFLIAIIAIIAFILILLLNKKPQEILVNVLPVKYQTRLRIIIEKVTESVAFLKEGSLFSRILLFTFFIWLGIFARCFVILLGLGIILPFNAYFFIVSVGVLGMVIPSSPGNVGVYHAASMGAVMLFMVDKETAFTYSVISHAFDLIPNVIFGLFVLIKKNLSLAYLYRKNRPKG